MGGAQKSMLHPYEDLDTTFRELFSFAKTFAKGGTFKEKTDGCNLTWRFRDDKFYLARNYEHFRNHQGMLPASWHYVVVALQKPSLS